MMYIRANEFLSSARFGLLIDTRTIKLPMQQNAVTLATIVARSALRAEVIKALKPSPSMLGQNVLVLFCTCIWNFEGVFEFERPGPC